jgi:hypothetical protein
VIQTPRQTVVLRPTAEQVMDFITMSEAGVSVEEALIEAFPEVPVRLSSFYSVTDDGVAVAWDTCHRCHMHISMCKCKEIKVPEYIVRWSARRRGLVIDPVTGKALPPFTDTRTDVVTEEPVAEAPVAEEEPPT